MYCFISSFFCNSCVVDGFPLRRKFDIKELTMYAQLRQVISRQFPIDGMPEIRQYCYDKFV